jgi:uncharacterized protein
MPGGLLALLDDVTAVLDDVSVMTKVAARKTAGVLGDDLALNVQQVAGVRADRELHVVWAVAKGSALNKAILVPAALAISAFAPQAVLPLLMAGGTYLCLEGVEKLAHTLLHADRPPTIVEIGKMPEQAALPANEAAVECAKIRGAIRTDFVLSAEIIVITLGTVAGVGFPEQVAVLIAVAAIMLVGVYGLVAGIVRLDDVGRYLARWDGIGLSARFMRPLGRSILGGAPYLMRTLSIVGTAAMFLVGGGILTHGIPGAHDMLKHYVVEPAAGVPVVGGLLAGVTAPLADAAVGIAAGAIALAVVLAGRTALLALGVVKKT